MATAIVKHGELDNSPKQLTNEMLAELKKPLPPEAVKPHPTKPYLSTIKVPYVIERLNEVFGIGGWRAANTVIEKNELMVVVETHLLVPEYGIDVQQFGGNDNVDRGDAYKGACTDALSKCASYLGIGMDVYKGLTERKANGVQPVRRASEKKTDADIEQATYVGPEDDPFLAGTGGNGHTGKRITDGQRKRLYAIWKQNGVNDEEVKNYLKKQHGFESTKEVTAEKYEEIIAWLSGGSPA